LNDAQLEVGAMKISGWLVLGAYFLLRTRKNAPSISNEIPINLLMELFGQPKWISLQST
jgi:hypothetical protein